MKLLEKENKENKIEDEMSTTDIDKNETLKNKFKKVVFPTIITLVILGISIALIFIIKFTN